MERLNASVCPERSFQIFGVTLWPREHEPKATLVHYHGIAAVISLKCRHCHFREQRLVKRSELYWYGLSQPKTVLIDTHDVPAILR